METIGERVKAIRKEMHITQVEMGAMLGITGSAISQVEAGASRLTDAALKLICSTYHINYLWLTEGDGPMMQALNRAELVEQAMAGESPLAISIMKAFAELPDDEWVRLRDMIDRIKKEGHP